MSEEIVVVDERLAALSAKYGFREAVLPKADGGEAPADAADYSADDVEGFGDEDMDDGGIVNDMGDMLLAVHDGKTAVIRDFAVSTDGECYFLELLGPAQIVNGIFAALVDQGIHNSERVEIEEPTNWEGSSILFKERKQIRIPRHAVGSMRHKRVAMNKAKDNIQASTIYSELLRHDYDYRHVSRPAGAELAGMESYARKELDKNLARFIIMEDVDRGETELELAERWYGFLTRRIEDAMLGAWALPLWRRCSQEEIGVRELLRMRGRAWICEPSRSQMRAIIREMGVEGKLALPEWMGPSARERGLDSMEAYRAARAAAD